ncbi:MAG: hypothetical protein GQ544_06060 [Candidatus Aminicenantes bacterium]|nr:hypothetical protein [Candidatus Aminicenantes bacterium]
MKPRIFASLVGMLLTFCWQSGVLFALTLERPLKQGSEDQHKITAYEVRASVIILGDMGAVGSMKIEESSKRVGDMLEKVLYLYGNTDPKQVEKGRDIGGEFRITKRFPQEPDESRAEATGTSGQSVENFYRGTLKRNEKVTGEEVIFFPDHIISTREDGKETRIQGQFGSPLAALEYLIENDIQTGDVFESKFILNGHPYVFKCEVEEPELLEELDCSAFKVIVSTYDWAKRNKYGKLVAIKKKGIRVWFCKEGEYKNTVVQMNIKYKWFLTLKIHLIQPD